MEAAILSVLQLDIVSIVIGIFIIISAIVSSATLIGKFCELIGKPVKWFQGKNKDHDILMTTVKSEEELNTTMMNFIKEVRSSIAETQSNISQFAENRIHDREQSFSIQKELTDSIKELAEGHKARDKQITALMTANKESLADRINQKYKYYLSIGGIPEDEYDEFVSLHSAYKALGGNHTGDAKFNYCMEHLSIIPVDVKLKFDEK